MEAGGPGESKIRFNISAKEEKELVKEAEYEFRRRCRFKRIFPSIDYEYYKRFFTKERPLNVILDQKVM